MFGNNQFHIRTSTPTHTHIHIPFESLASDWSPKPPIQKPKVKDKQVNGQKPKNLLCIVILFGIEILVKIDFKSMTKKNSFISNYHIYL